MSDGSVKVPEDGRKLYETIVQTFVPNYSSAFHRYSTDLHFGLPVFICSPLPANDILSHFTVMARLVDC
jgi:hypothetical protein